MSSTSNNSKNRISNTCAPVPSSSPSKSVATKDDSRKHPRGPEGPHSYDAALKFRDMVPAQKAPSPDEFQVSLRTIAKGQALIQNMESTKALLAAYQIDILCKYVDGYEFPTEATNPPVILPVANPPLEEKFALYENAQACCDGIIKRVERTMVHVYSILDRQLEYEGSSATTEENILQNYASNKRRRTEQEASDGVPRATIGAISSRKANIARTTVMPELGLSPSLIPSDMAKHN
ncbi:hypothetical protein BGX28_001354 [Mortierella sp. GBA30]|nr:hypothetical protein BGX28_001354 [Mortierella sp. GBA30]